MLLFFSVASTLSWAVIAVARKVLGWDCGGRYGRSVRCSRWPTSLYLDWSYTDTCTRTRWSTFYPWRRGYLWCTHIQWCAIMLMTHTKTHTCYHLHTYYLISWPLIDRYVSLVPVTVRFLAYPTALCVLYRCICLWKGVVKIRYITRGR